ncbi:MAG: DUF3073 domain-containing protein [Bifidobacteriaceae bacterium]|jgi:hypothetical protein|nr:DUF3073 domain-containing protein [Bifidobacteriaceae bacterium]
MGRGRQKAKQTKVARKLKYYTPDTDYRALERELSGASGADLEDDPYAEYAARYAAEEEGSSEGET